MNLTICQCSCPDYYPEPTDYDRNTLRWNSVICQLENIPTIAPPSTTTEITTTTTRCTKPTDYDPDLKRWNLQKCALECIVDLSNSVPLWFTWNPDECYIECRRTDFDCSAPHVLNPSTCLCECPDYYPEPTNYDHSIHRWNNQTCALECINDLSTTNIPDFKKWDKTQCKIVCLSPQSCIFQGQIFNEDLCTCSCPNEATTTCVSPQFFDPRQGCKCVGPCNIPAPIGGCEDRKYWNFDSCQCLCNNENPTCDSNKKWNSNTCACDCLNIFICTQPDVHYYNSKLRYILLKIFVKQFFSHLATTCGCECMDDVPPGGCASNHKWFPEFCGCFCQNHLTDRLNCSNPALPRRWSSSKCQCECKVKPVCNAATHNTNLVTCACDCINPARVCTTGFVWSRSVCDCIKV
jgi:CXCXC repeat